MSSALTHADVVEASARVSGVVIVIKDAGHNRRAIYLVTRQNYFAPSFIITCGINDTTLILLRLLTQYLFSLFSVDIPILDIPHSEVGLKI